jgi:hypothetical protein
VRMSRRPTPVPTGRGDSSVIASSSLSVSNNLSIGSSSPTLTTDHQAALPTEETRR